MYNFGSGVLWGTPLTDATGAAIASPTPLIFGTMQDVDVDIKFDMKTLHGQNAFPVAVGRGKGQITGKAKMADIRAAFLETIALGSAGSSGLTSAVYDTVGVTVATTVAITPPASGTFAADLGVISAATGREFKRVASAPTAGQYSLSGSTYTFAAGDVGQTVFINYRYTATSTVARNIAGTNQLMGYAPSFRADLYMAYQGKSWILTLHNCIAEGIKMSPKNDDFSVPEVSFTAFANAAGQVYNWSVSE
jgi:hypothetical protein